MNDRERRTEARLRAAIAARTAAVTPRDDSLAQIEEKLMSEPTTSNRNRWLLGGLAAAAVIIIVALVVTNSDDGDTDVVADEPTSTTETTAPTTTAIETTTTTVFEPTVDPTQAIFPAVDQSSRFEDPVAAARAFAIDGVGFDSDVIVSEFRQGDSRSGEVELRAFDQGPATVVQLRMLEDDTWYVIGASTEDINPTEPAVDAEISSPVTLRGEALAFEGNVNVEIREQGRAEPIGEGFVTGSGSPPAGPYEGEIEFSTPSVGTGVILYRELSAEDGSVVWAAATRVQFA